MSIVYGFPRKIFSRKACPCLGSAKFIQNMESAMVIIIAGIKGKVCQRRMKNAMRL